MLTLTPKPIGSAIPIGNKSIKIFIGKHLLTDIYYFGIIFNRYWRICNFFLGCFGYNRSFFFIIFGTPVCFGFTTHQKKDTHNPYPFLRNEKNRKFPVSDIAVHYWLIFFNWLSFSFQRFNSSLWRSMFLLTSLISGLSALALEMN